MDTFFGQFYKICDDGHFSGHFFWPIGHFYRLKTSTKFGIFWAKTGIFRPKWGKKWCF